MTLSTDTSIVWGGGGVISVRLIRYLLILIPSNYRLTLESEGCPLDLLDVMSEASRLGSYSRTRAMFTMSSQDVFDNPPTPFHMTRHKMAATRVV